MQVNFSFQAVFEKEKFNAVPFYSFSDSSFGCEPFCSDCSIMIDKSYTALEMSLLDNTICGISGYNPKEKWIKEKLSYPKTKAICGQLRLAKIDSVPSGSAFTYNREWSTFFDPESKVVCIGDTQLNPEMILVEFCNNMIAALLGDKLVSLWLLPTFRE